jgi:hypothetical protein
MLPLHQTSRRTLINRTVVAGLAACAIAPASAIAMPEKYGPVTPDQGVNLHTPDQTTGGGIQERSGLDVRTPDSMPGSRVDATFPVPLPVPQITTVETSLPDNGPATVADDGTDVEIWIAAGAAGILLASGIGMVTRVRVRRHSVA